MASGRSIGERAMARAKRIMKWNAKRNCWRKSKSITLPDGTTKVLRKDFRYPQNQTGYRQAVEEWERWLQNQLADLGVDSKMYQREATAMAKWAVYTRTPIKQLLPTPPEMLPKLTIEDAPDIDNITDAHLFTMLKGIEDGKIGAEEIYLILATHIRLREATAGAPFIQEQQTVAGHTFVDVAEKFLEVKQQTMTKGGYINLVSVVKKIIEWAEEEKVIHFEAGTVEQFWAWIRERKQSGGLGSFQANKYIKTLRSILKYGHSREMIDRLPKNLDSRMYTFHVETANVVAPTVEDVREFLRGEMSDSMRLVVLLSLNTGSTQQEILDLINSDAIDLVAGTIRKRRGKTKAYSNAPTVQFPVWPEVAELLKSTNVPWKTARRIAQEWNKLKNPLTFKFLRKAGSSTLATHLEYSRFEQLYLGHVATSIAEKHYTATPQEQFNSAVMWLRTQFLD